MKNMNDLYIGKIILKQNINFKKIKFNIDENNIISIIKPNYDLSGAESYALYNYFNKFENDKKFKINDLKSKIIIDRITYKFFEIGLTEMNIIYKKIILKNGEIFGKEINTGIIFPFLSLNDIDLEYYVKLDNKYGVIVTNLNTRDCFSECKSYIIDEKKVTNDKMENYQKKKKLEKRKEKLERLANTFRYDIEENESQYNSSISNFNEFINSSSNKPKVYQKVYKI